MILGIDEAGRGPALGPLVVCGVCVRLSDQPRLAAIGVKDSKAFGSSERARANRTQLAQRIREMALVVELEVAEAEEVDSWTSAGGLNRLEQQLARRIIERMPETRQVVADGTRVFAPLSAHCERLEALNGADRTYPVVAAASIVAKVERDARMERLFDSYGDEFRPIRGGGYPNAATADFLRRYVERHSRLPAGVRTSWSWGVLAELGVSQAPAGGSLASCDGEV